MSIEMVEGQNVKKVLTDRDKGEKGRIAEIKNRTLVRCNYL